MKCLKRRVAGIRAGVAAIGYEMKIRFAGVHGDGFSRAAAFHLVPI
jgi:hypothetical protein